MGVMRNDSLFWRKEYELHKSVRKYRDRSGEEYYSSTTPEGLKTKCENQLCTPVRNHGTQAHQYV